MTPLTELEKIMNMAKLGIVSAALNHPAKSSKPINHGLYKVTPYTLCESNGNPTWHSWRNSFAFYVRRISSRALSICRSVGKFGSYVIPELHHPEVRLLPNPSPARLPERHIFGFLRKLFQLRPTATIHKNPASHAHHGFKPFLSLGIPQPLQMNFGAFLVGGRHAKSAIQSVGSAEGLGTSPHGLSVDSSQPHQEGRGQGELHSLADGLGVGVSASGSHAQQSEHGEQAARVKPEIYRNPHVRSCCRSIKAAVLKHEPSRHHLTLDDTEFLHLWFALENSRSKLRKAIGKGLAEVGDLRATDSAWMKLAAIMTRRQQRRPA